MNMTGSASMLCNKYQDEKFLNSKNRDYWNIVKGIGILSIVLGHTCYFAISYVYAYHLALFFFVGGYLFSEEKYGDKPWNNIASRLGSLWPRYVFFSVVFTLFHNKFLKLGIIIDEGEYTLRDCVTNAINALVFSFSGGKMGGALWFVPVYIFAMGLFGMIMFTARKIANIFSNGKLKYVTVFIFGLLMGIIGVVLNMKNVNLCFHIETSFVVIPIIMIAFLTRSLCNNMNVLIKAYIAIPLAFLLFYLVRFSGWRIELSVRQIIGPWQFYFISLIGIYVCLYLARLLMRGVFCEIVLL